MSDSDRFATALSRLSATIAARQGDDPSQSYTAKLLSQGPVKAAQKLGEEAIETALAAALNDADGVASESADLIYHWLVLLRASGVSLDEVAAKLEAREGQSGLAEKAARKP
jgi:phosphoribosyl-ATP pyrophosphohydrolase